MPISIQIPTPDTAEIFENFTHESIVVLLPTYCEIDNIESLIHKINRLDLNSAIVVVDDSSPDGTAEAVIKLHEKYGNVHLISRPRKLGLGTAITDGFNIVLSLRNAPDYVVTMDADYSHNPQALPKLLDSARGGYDLVIGSRYTTSGKIVGWHVIRRLISRVANFLASTMVAMRIHDCTSGYRCYSKNYIQSVVEHLHSQTYEIQIETIKQAWTRRFRIKEVPITFESRKEGKSKLTKAEFQGFLSYILRTKMSLSYAAMVTTVSRLFASGRRKT